MDMACFDKDIVREEVKNALVKAQMDPHPRHVEWLMEALMRCSCTKTKEGFEACINIHKEDLGIRSNDDPHFDQLLRQIETLGDSLKQTWYEEHKL